MVDKAELDRAVAAALDDGPAVARIKVDRHEFDVQPVAVTDGRIRGQLSRRLAFRDDEQVYYECRRPLGHPVKLFLGERWTALALDPAATTPTELLDGSWQGEAAYLVLSIVGRLRTDCARAAY